VLSNSDINEIQAMVFRVWPKTEWAAEQVNGFVLVARKLPLDLNQAKTAITFHSTTTKYRSVSVAEIVEALRGAIAVVKRTEEIRSTKSRRAYEIGRDIVLQRLPMDLRFEAMARIDEMLRRAGKLSHVGRGIQTAATQALDNWPDALDHAAFRHEVKQCPQVRAWLDTQEIPQVDLDLHATTSTNT